MIKPTSAKILAARSQRVRVWRYPTGPLQVVLREMKTFVQRSSEAEKPHMRRATHPVLLCVALGRETLDIMRSFIVRLRALKESKCRPATATAHFGSDARALSLNFATGAHPAQRVRAPTKYGRSI